MSSSPSIQRVAVTGASGLLGRALLPLLIRQGYQVIAGVHRSGTALPDSALRLSLDLLDPASIHDFVARAEADWIVHAAAITDVDGCENDPALAEAVNTAATRHLMTALQGSQSRVLYISTDYVFDGLNGPYSEDDTPAPVNVYGGTKLAGEEAVKSAGGRHAIIRSASFLGVGPPNRPAFAESMLLRIQDSPPLVVAVDQCSNVTHVEYLAAAVVEIGASGYNGVWHVAGSEILSRYEFALRLARQFNLDESAVKGVPYKDLKRAAARPLNGGLISHRSLSAKPVTLDEALRRWRQTLEARASSGDLLDTP